MLNIITFIFETIIPIVLVLIAIGAAIYGVNKLAKEKDDRYVLIILGGIILLILTISHPIITSIIAVIISCSFLFENS